MKKCQKHYPILGNWKIVERSRDYNVYKCPKCGEIKILKIHKGKLLFLPERIRKDAKIHERDITQPYLDAETANPKFAEYYQDDPKVNLRDFYTDKEIKKMVGKKYLKSHKAKEPIKKDLDNPKLETETVGD